jgi:predicted HTH transcriptional regulator
MEAIEKAYFNKVNQIMKAVEDYNNNPVKAEKYIRNQIDNIWEAGKKTGSMCVVDELFG